MSKRMHLGFALVVMAALTLPPGVFAWFLGPRSGSGRVAQDAGNDLTVLVRFDGSGPVLLPGESAGFTVTVSNDSASRDVRVNGVALDPGHGDDGIRTSDQASCLDSWFSVSNLALARGSQTIAAGGSAGGTGTFTFDNVNADQSACVGKTISIRLETN
jgi:hypothetical protein